MRLGQMCQLVIAIVMVTIYAISKSCKDGTLKIICHFLNCINQATRFARNYALSILQIDKHTVNL